LNVFKQKKGDHMNVQVKTNGGIQTMEAATRLLSDRKIFLEGEITSESALEFVKQYMFLYSEDPELPIDILINSPGGEIDSGLIIYDIIQDSKVELNLYCIGRAYSMAAVLFCSGAKGHRFMLNHSKLMLHEPLLGGKVGGSSSSIKSIADSLIDNKNKLNAIIAKHTGKAIEEVEEATSYDHYYNVEESIAFGLCDEMVGFSRVLG